MKYLSTSAELSDDGLYRYTLERVWDRQLPMALFIGLNPSTADSHEDDPTIRRCVGFAKDWGYGRLLMANLFAFRATDPSQLKLASDPIGSDNDRRLCEMYHEAQLVVACWGANGGLGERDRQVTELLWNSRSWNVQLQCLGVTQAGFPKHPLYLAKDTPLNNYGGRPR